MTIRKDEYPDEYKRMAPGLQLTVEEIIDKIAHLEETWAKEI